ncbi:MAG: type VI secretion system tip protein VgrG [Syntrophales bacterium]|jgi:type VI secretion system secreted protein VgrG|nr:type VI secretion system tip protein VgrG [Syntrophales bacterium]MCK9390871.1 type VI secretion system tip protein VgrG [Syntrophales bacterium]
MDYFTAKKFSFISKALPEDTFGVISMKGSEGISKPYEFEIMLVSGNLEVDFDVIMQGTAKLVFHRETGGDAIYNGIITHFEYLHAIGDYALYRAYLVPRLWWLSITKHNQIILDKSLPEFARMVLIDGGLTADDFEFRLHGDYDPVEYVCQYNESHLNFLSRWLEREGIYYYFDQTESGEKVIFTDTRLAHTELAAGKVLTYSPPSGLEALRAAEVVASFHCRRSLMPEKVFLKDYNYRTPSLEMTGEANVDPKGRGTVFFYNEHIKTPEEGKRLAKIRAESILCRREVYLGEGSVPFMLPGFTFSLENHDRKDFNHNYLITDIDHEGNQTGYLLSGISVGQTGDEENKVYYRNNFNAIPGPVQFRPEAKAEKPKISGTISGMIDAAGSGQYAELDPQGRYKILFPFDLSGRTGGKASNWVRMAQPYAGSDHGMNFPLHKGTEVLITFIDGDPDRPIIAGAVPNPETPSPVNADNQSMSVINTAGKNRIAIEDQAGSERILLHSPNQGSYVRIGAPNDPPPADAPDWKGDTMKKDPDHFGMHLYTDGLLDIEAASSNSVILGEETSTIVGLSVDTVLGADIDLCAGERFITSAIAYHEYSPTKWGFSATDTDVKALRTEIHDTKTALRREHNKVVATELKVTNLKTELANQKIELDDDILQAVTTLNGVYATKAEVATAKTEAIAEGTTLLGSATQAIAEQYTELALQTTAIGDSVGLLGTKVENIGEATKIIVAETKVTTESNHLAGLLSII